jgi:beta-lactam-binding protein with PASTA domain
VPGDAKKVPDVISFPVDDALRILKDAGFKVEQVAEASDEFPPNRVISTDPGPGERAAKGTVVVIYVSTKTETVTVPDVLGMKEGDAKYVLEDAGFEVVIIEEAESDEKEAHKRRGRVWKQSPGGGSEAEKGSEVVIWVNPE